jgi:hypothetical protein
MIRVARWTFVAMRRTLSHGGLLQADALAHSQPRPYQSRGRRPRESERITEDLAVPSKSTAFFCGDWRGFQSELL